MNIMHKLALKQLLKNKKRTAVTLLGIILSVAMITSVLGFVISTHQVFIQTFKNKTGDWHVAFSSVDAQQAAEITQDSAVGAYYTQQEDGVPILRFRLAKPGKNTEETAGILAEKYGVDKDNVSINRELLAIEGYGGNNAFMSMLLAVGAVLVIVIMAGSIIVIANAFYISASERTRQFGILRSTGATKAQIASSVVAEGLLLSVIAIPAGIVLGHVIQLVALSGANLVLADVNQFGSGRIVFNMVFSVFGVIVSALVSIATVLISAWMPAHRASKISPIEAIRQTDKIKIDSSAVKIPGFVPKLFGFEGALAAKTTRRNKGKYRAAVISLVISMLLFISASTFGVLFQNSANVYFKDLGYNVLVMLNAEPEYLQDQAVQDMVALPDGEYSVANHLRYGAALQEEFISAGGKELFSEYAGSETPVVLHVLEQETFDLLCSGNGIKPDDMQIQDGISKGILVNSASLQTDDKWQGVVPFSIKDGTQMHLSAEGKGDFPLEIAASVKEVPDSIYMLFNNRYMNLIVSSQTADDNLLDAGKLQTSIAVKAQQPETFTEKANLIGKELLPEKSYKVVDFARQAQFNQDIGMVVQYFVYGFVTMLSLIAVVSVIGTISTGMALRRQEFAMLSSVGMTRQGLGKMIGFESLFYGLKAIAIGLPLGGIASYLLYQAVGLSFQFDFELPWMHMLISSVAVLCLNFFTMAYGASKIKNKSIVEMLRQDSI